jgi:hypothetical protein
LPGRAKNVANNVANNFPPPDARQTAGFRAVPDCAYRPMLDATHALSDELRAFAEGGRAPRPPVGKFYLGIDTIVCGFPNLPDGSCFDQHRHVTVLGYDALLDRLQRPGPRIPWSDADWDAFGQHPEPQRRRSWPR